MELDSKTLSYPVLIQDDNGGSGSGFYITQNSELYLVTARHVLFNRQGSRISNILVLTSYNHDFPNYRGKLRIELDTIEIHSRSDRDIAILKLAKQKHRKNDERFDLKFYKGVEESVGSTHPEDGQPHIFIPPEENLIKLDQVKVSSDVFVLGFPSSLGRESDQIDPEMPLLRKGSVAGINRKNKTIILDCPVYFGNSGGIAISVTDNHYYVIGVVSQYVPFIEHMVSKENKYTNQNIENSGYSVAVPLDTIFKLIDTK